MSPLRIRSFGLPEDFLYVVDAPYVPLGYRIYFITMDRAKKEEYPQRLEGVSWDLIVVDEAHRLRLRTLRGRLSLLLRKVESVLLLTATPHTGDEASFRLLQSLVKRVYRRDKEDLKRCEGKDILPKLKYTIVRIEASEEGSKGLDVFGVGKAYDDDLYAVSLKDLRDTEYNGRRVVVMRFEYGLQRVDYGGR